MKSPLLTLLLLIACMQPIKAQFSAVVNPEIPLQMTFAGEKLDLSRIDLAERLDRELTSMVYTHGNTLLTIKRANRFFPMLEPILRRNNIHPDFLYLACIESFLDPFARSGAGAAGLWQIMPATAKQYGLEVNDEVDERYDPIKATEAACAFLRTCYAKYGHWEAVASAYNGGAGRISGELAAQGVDSAFNLWLASETRRYPFRMIAMKLIMEHPEQYGYQLEDYQLYRPWDVVEETVTGPVDSWPDWALSHATDYATLREYNPWIRAKQLTNTNNRTYVVRIPKPTSLKR